MKNYLIILCLSILVSQEHFIVEINETGESTLFIFENTITTLAVGDEIGIFDTDGIIDEFGTIGEILVGAGVWNGSQLAIVGIESVNLSDFGGPILPGAIPGNNMTLKGWSNSNQIEYSIDYITEQSGIFNGIFSAISSLSCPVNIDTCGVCYGSGDIYECGCYDIADGACDCEGNILDECSVCDGSGYIDQCGVCDDDPSNDCELDCLGIWGGSAIIDECGICDGPGSIYECGCYDIEDSACDCSGNIEDCEGVCGGDAQIDDCGICNGDGTQCDNAEVILSFYDLGGIVLTNISYENLLGEVCLENVVMSNIEGSNLVTSVGNCVNFNNIQGSFPIYMKNNQSVAGFQFNITGLEILEASGGEAENAGFMVSTSTPVVLGFSFSGSSIDPSGYFWGCLDSNACNYNPNANMDDNSCEYAQENYDCNGNCIFEDCLGECGGSAQLDECGICNGPGAIFECEDGSFVCFETECDNDGGGGDGGGGGTGGECENENEILDCFGNCAPSSWLGDGYCDESMADYNCLDFAYDMGDCQIDFTYHVMPLIAANCTGYCHSGAANYQGGLNLDSYSGLMDGGNSGLAVQPFYPDYSLIIHKLNGTAPGEQMPDGADPLPENYINTIYYWIEQGALGPDDGWEDGCVEENEIADCDGNCVNESLLGNGNCDDGEEGEANFNCSQFIFDDADCPVGVLEFGNYTYNETNGSGQIEILMNCEFPVSNFEIEINGIEISGIAGGNAQSSNFNMSFTSSIITGENSSDDYIPPNSGLLTVLNYDSIYPDTQEICFSNSSITTSAGYEYSAVLGECIPIDLLGNKITLPSLYKIESVYPNPFNPIAKITYTIPENENVVLNVYNIAGKKIKTLVNKYHVAGYYETNWDATSLASGLYIVELKTNTQISTYKITLAK